MQKLGKWLRCIVIVIFSAKYCTHACIVLPYFFCVFRGGVKAFDKNISELLKICFAAYKSARHYTSIDGYRNWYPQVGIIYK